jgi:hypothetical protein
MATSTRSPAAVESSSGTAAAELSEVHFEVRASDRPALRELWLVSSGLGIGWRLDAALRADARCTATRSEVDASVDPSPTSHWTLVVACDPAKGIISISYSRGEIRVGQPAAGEMAGGNQMVQAVASGTAVQLDTEVLGQPPVPSCDSADRTKLGVELALERTTLEGERKVFLHVRSKRLSLDAVVYGGDDEHCAVVQASARRWTLRCDHGTAHSVGVRNGVLEFDDGLRGAVVLPCGASVAASMSTR